MSRLRRRLLVCGAVVAAGGGLISLHESPGVVVAEAMRQAGSMSCHGHPASLARPDDRWQTVAMDGGREVRVPPEWEIDPDVFEIRPESDPGIWIDAGYSHRTSEPAETDPPDWSYWLKTLLPQGGRWVFVALPGGGCMVEAAHAGFEAAVSLWPLTTEHIQWIRAEIQSSASPAARKKAVAVVTSPGAGRR